MYNQAWLLPSSTMSPQCTWAYIRKHFQTHPQTDFRSANIFGCTRCDKTFKGKGGLAMHITSAHKNMKLFAFKYCSLMFRRSFSLKSHERIHTGETPYECKLCNIKFTHLYLLHSHMEKNHGRPKPKSKKQKRKCEKCEYKTTSKKLMDIHKWKHTGEKPYKCPICESAKTRQWGLRQHMMKSHEFTEQDLVQAKLYSYHHSAKITG